MVDAPVKSRTLYFKELQVMLKYPHSLFRRKCHVTLGLSVYELERCAPLVLALTTPAQANQFPSKAVDMALSHATNLRVQV